MIPVRPDPLTDPLPGGHLRYAYAAASVPAATGRTIRRWFRGLVHESHLRHAAALVLCYGVSWPLPAAPAVPARVSSSRVPARLG